MEHENESARETVEATTPVSELEAEFKRCFDLNDKSGMLEAHRKLIERLASEKLDESDPLQTEKPENPAVLIARLADEEKSAQSILHQAESHESSPLAFDRHRNVEANAFLNACVNAQKGAERVGRNTLSDFETDSTVLAFKPRTSQPIFESTDDANSEDEHPKVYGHRLGLDEMRAVQGKSKSKSGAQRKDSVIETGHLPVVDGDKSDDTKAVIAAAREQAKRAREESKALELELEKKRALHRTEMLAKQDDDQEGDSNDDSVNEVPNEKSEDAGVSTGDLFVPVGLEIKIETDQSLDEVKATQDFRPESKTASALSSGDGKTGAPESILARLHLQPSRRAPRKALEPVVLAEKPVSYYEILGIDRLASNKEVETAFLRRVRILLECSAKDHVAVSNDLVTFFVARDVILDCLSREDHDFRVLSLKRSATENQADRSEDDRNAKKLEIAEALAMAGLLEASEVDLALEMHLPNKGQLFSDFLVENKMVEIEQLEASVLGRSLVKDGRLKLNWLKRIFHAARSYAVDFIDALLVAIDITPEEILELSRSLALKTISEKVSLKMFLLKPEEKVYVHTPAPPVELSQETTQRLQTLLSFDKPEESP